MEFATRDDWRAWLDVHHPTSRGVFLLIARKGSGRQTVSYAEALEVALCYGWIDGQKQRHDDGGWLQKFTPRGARSVRSKLNRERAEALISSGEMRPPGLAEVARAKADRRWVEAYDSQSTGQVPSSGVTPSSGWSSRQAAGSALTSTTAAASVVLACTASSDSIERYRRPTSHSSFCSIRRLPARRTRAASLG
jgi:hypothetical protein